MPRHRGTPRKDLFKLQSKSGEDKQSTQITRRQALKSLAAMGLLAAVDVTALSSCGRRPSSLPKPRKRMILLGIDGLDPQIISRMMGEGKLPNLSRLMEMGGCREIATTIPPQSPVAWATVITGRDPGFHGIYDFLHRDPSDYGPVSALASIAPPKYCLPVHKWRLPLMSSQATTTRNGVAFWELLEDQGIPCGIYRVPSNFPPKDNGAKQIAGLGTPDIRGTKGGASYYFTEEPASRNRNVLRSQVRIVNNQIKARLEGPPNSLRSGYPRTSVEFDVWLDRQRRMAKVVIQGSELLLRQGEWSNWVPVRFTFMPKVKSAAGICRFYLKEVVPRFKLYVTPIHFDPMAPPLPVDAPRGYAQELATKFGRFYTAGLPEDTTALSEDVLDDDEYLHQAQTILDEDRRLYESLLNEFDEGLFFYYFGTTDRNQHMFWRTMDPLHPQYEAATARRYGDVVESCYLVSDELAGQALDACDEQTTLVLFSDHGFAPYYRRFHLNTWLVRNNYMRMRTSNDIGEIKRHVDWSNTAAYGLGLNGLYLNLAGREKEGSVSPAQREALVASLAKDLKAVRDPETGTRVVANVYIPERTYESVNPSVAPDLILGYARGYRCSVSSGEGRVGPHVIDPNTSKWSGDHCIDAAAVPGVALSNRSMAARPLNLIDIPVTALSDFGVKIPPALKGKPLWRG